MRTRVPLNGFCQKPPRIRNAPAPRNFYGGIHQKTLANNMVIKFRDFSTGFRLRALANIYGMRTRVFSNGSPQKALEDSSEAGGCKTLPWIAAYRNREVKGFEKKTSARSSNSSWEESGNSYFLRNGRKLTTDDRECTVQTTEGTKNWSSSSDKAAKGEKEEEEEENEDVEPINDPRWNRIKNKYKGFISRESRVEKPEVVKWNKQENWGRKTWKEATESTVPKMVGEGVYGVGPVLAALTVGRREFYVLYVQEGLDLSGNNRKKKDKKGVEKILRMAEKIGLTVKETSKHDLNMVVDNRPHQGLVLDASPLEMVNIRELEPVLVNKEDKVPLWVALDEVTDPQNLGAIVRSAYYFGVEGVILCAKNSAPLSGVVSKASAGSLELIELRSCKNMMQFLSSSVENGWRVLGGSVSSQALPLSEVETGAPTILVLGSEGSGLRPLVERSCSQLVRIPGNIPSDVYAGGNEEEEGEEMEKRHLGQEFKYFLAVESLNVSVAAGVLLYHLVRNNNHPVVDKQTDV